MPRSSATINPPRSTEAPRVVRSAADFAELLESLTGLAGELPGPMAAAIADVIARLGPSTVPPEAARSNFYGRINQKLMAHRATLAEIYSYAAGHGVTFNYPTKRALSWAVDSADRDAFEALIQRECPESADLREGLADRFLPLGQDDTRDLILAEASAPTKLRKAHERDVQADVFQAAAGSLLWSLWDTASLHRFFQPDSSPMEDTGDYLADLRAAHPALFNRDRALVVRSLDPAREGYERYRDDAAQWLADEYGAISNYGFLAVLVTCRDDCAAAWELSADLTLAGERFLEHPLQKGFFRSAEVEQETVSYIPRLSAEAGEFELINEGFTYRDLFVLGDDQGRVTQLLLLFQKNERDETMLPCPACRSIDVAGNSYPSLGVKSWECRNPLCPDRSIYNRGKRYSFKALINQAAIEHPENAIPAQSVRKWQRDVVAVEGVDEVLDMLLRHYSMAGDAVALIDLPFGDDAEPLGRRVLTETSSVPAARSDFFSSAAFFRRYDVPAETPPALPTSTASPEPGSPWTVVEAESGEYLASVPDDSFDRAITSPPYFNAREYAQWPNLYTYLYDMRRINAQVFRTLKPGALYAYNVFDYFDNERTIVFSAMGKKRVSLSSLMVDLFRRIGFELAGVAVWDKGDTQGKRGFNAGNRSPFYQSPFNCWEHVLVVRKPGQDGHPPHPCPAADEILRIHPVVKMVRGKNLVGHSAPFPLDLPGRFLSDLPAGSVVLDPFAGSGTTGRAALDRGLRSVLVERNAEYAQLCRRSLEEHAPRRLG